MNIPGVSVWNAGNGIFIEYFGEYLWETLVVTSVFVLLRHNFFSPKLHLSFCLSVSVSVSLLLSLFLSSGLVVYTVSIFLCLATFLSVRFFSNNFKTWAQSNPNLNLIPNTLKYQPSYHRNPSLPICPAGYSLPNVTTWSYSIYTGSQNCL